MKVCFCMKMPHESYVGGIAAIMNSYISSKDLFAEHGIDISLFDQDMGKLETVRFFPVQTFLYGQLQYKGLCKKIENEEFDILHIHTSRRTLFLKDVLLLRKLYRKYGIKICLTIHVGDISTVFKKIPKFMHQKLICALNECAYKVIFLSDRMRKQFIESGLEGKITETLYNFSDLRIVDDKANEVVFPDHTDTSESGLSLLFVGMINHDKGIIELLNAVNQMKNIPLRLDVCGTVTDNSVKNEFNTLVESSEGRVVLHGYVQGNDKIALYRDADILVLPSYNEGLPLVILEALTAGCAIIATPVGAIPEILSKKNVEWIEIGSVGSIEDAIRDFANNDTKLAQMKRANLELSKKYTKEAHISQLCELYVK